MSHSYWRVIAAIGCLIFCGASQPQEQAQGHKPESPRAQNASQQSVSPAAPVMPAPTMQAQKTDKYERPCREPKNDSESALCASWQAAEEAQRSADWAERQTWLGVFGFLGLIATLIYTAVGTNAAVDAVEAQVNADRPLVVMNRATFSRNFPEGLSADCEKDSGIMTSWAFQNYGATPCWTEAICIRYAGHEPPEDLNDLCNWNKFISFVPAGKGVANKEGAVFVGFETEEFDLIKRQGRIFVYGQCAYRDAGGRRWLTGFAGVVDLDINMVGSGFGFHPSEVHWTDKRIKSGHNWKFGRLEKNENG